ncbi:MAG: hypothetical protein JWO67_3133 [Streptosporangiaceae bacterium]|nr:hypothetical protein [Streptosporangiaceae bacterium]
MSGPLYVPVLPTRPHAAQAYRRLRPDVQSAVVPLWNLPPHPGWAPAAFATDVRKDLRAVRMVQRHHPAWVDAPFAEDTQIPTLADALSSASAAASLRPVTGPGRPEPQQTAALETARRIGCGLGVRVRVTGEWDGGTTEAVRDLLARADPTVSVDLLLDLGSVLADRPDAGKEALRALDALIPLAPWRTAATLGGSFPDATAAMLEQGLREEPRMDWQMWQEISDSSRAYLPLLSYGDYGAMSTSVVARVPTPDRKGGPPWGVLRYTTERSFVLCKVLARGDDRVAVNRAAARQILDLADFRGATASDGESWLRDCARGPATSSSGTGGPAEWLRVGNVQHMTYIVRSLRGS